MEMRSLNGSLSFDSYDASQTHLEPKKGLREQEIIALYALASQMIDAKQGE